MSDADVFGAPALAHQASPSNGALSDDDVFGPTPSHQAVQPKQIGRSWADVPGEAASNLLPSVGNFMASVAAPVLHPIETAKSAYGLWSGLAAKQLELLGVKPDADTAKQEAMVDAVAKHYRDRYGSEAGIKEALATDPAGVAADAATVLTGGEAAAARAPGMVGKVARAAGNVGREINPVNAGVNAANAGIRGVNRGITNLRSAVEPVTAEQEAHAYVSDLAQKAGKTPDQVAAYMPGKPALGAEALGNPGINAARTLGTRAGQTGDALIAQLKERQSGAPSRIKSGFEEATGVSPEAARGDIDAVVQKGRADAKPLYDKAFDNGGTGAFIDPLEKHFDQATSRVTQARHDLTLATAKLSAAGDNAPATAFRSQEAAQKAYDEAVAGKNAVNTRLQRAYEDEENGVRGGVWSPRIQQFLDDPIMKRGINQGLEIQRLESLHDDAAPFNPKDYAITGENADGTPIIGGVPNMRLLDAGKRGLDQMIKEANTNQFGQYARTERGDALLGVKRAYLKELDSLNDDYGQARGVASDYLGAKGAFDNTAKMFSNSDLTAKQFSDYVAKLQGTDLEAAKGGVANWVFNQAEKGLLRGSTFKTPLMQKKLAAIIGDPAKVKAFIAHAEAEDDFARQGARMSPNVNSTTYGSQDAAAEQDRVGAAVDAGHAALKLVSGHPGAAAKHGASALQKIGAFAQTPAMAAPTRDIAGSALRMSPPELADYLRNRPTTPPRRGLIPQIPQSGRLGLLGMGQAGTIANQSPYRRGGLVP